MEITHFGSGICSQSWRITGAILLETRPAIIIKSDCRGEGRNTSAPNRAISKSESKARRAHRHHFNSKARQTECHRPNRIFAHPVYGVVESSQDNPFRRRVAVGEVVDDPLPLFYRDIWAEVEIAFHGIYSKSV